ncbi:Branched-chain amino acid aminotransferase 5 / branched-chain amino acid transaminase 5 (BCAT5), putative isoform 2 [Theobroma cacao]|uniref:Branched-chain amino acid aminotransferase 5 / branched-chain amino acid transaminase 5 (BCAT5), putative isoform 2 n=1 Tax=Theobroma cacao TaxID=3641 RepID=A0A061FFE6_THECC|nr:Branched-chain amino acid aminotransferase 5 / branched-chain amino acid transaminase 5 (BCAT5), putative isoform 2 [Theobroma cacao]
MLLVPLSFTNATIVQFSSSLKVHHQLRLAATSSQGSLPSSSSWRRATSSDSHSETSESADRRWDSLGFNPVQTDYMYVMKSSEDGSFADGGLRRYGNIEIIPAAAVLNYGQGIIEGLKAYKKQNGSIILFRPEENGLRLRVGAERLCMPAPTIEQFVEAVKSTVLANKRWVPPPDKGFLHIRPLLLGNGPVLSLTTAPEFTFLIYVTPVGNYFEGGLKPINLVVENETHRAAPGGVGSIKAIGNYAGNNTISTPTLGGTILPGVTRKSIIDIALSQGFQVEERLVSVEELSDADEVFCSENALCVLPVGSITYMDKRVDYEESGFVVSQQLYSALTNIQMGLTEDIMGWTTVLE